MEHRIEADGDADAVEASRDPMRTDELRVSLPSADPVVVVAAIGDTNRYYVMEAHSEIAGNGQRYLVLDLDHTSNWDHPAPTRKRRRVMSEDPSAPPAPSFS